MPRPVDAQKVIEFSNHADDLLTAVARSHAPSTQSLITKAVRQGSEVRLSYAPTSGVVSVALVHKNGTSNELFAAQMSDGADDEGE
jgi:hypothetical protein